MQPDQFFNELKQLVGLRSQASHLVDTLAFVEEVAVRLQEDPVFGEFERIEYQGSGSRNRTLKLHGFTRPDEADGSIGIVIARWEDLPAPSTLSTATVDQLTAWAENFVREAIENALHERIAPSNPAYELALQLYNDAAKISRIRVHLFSNLTLSSRFKEDLREQIWGIPVERHIWDLQRLSALYESNREREAVHIDLTTLGSPIPCIEAAHTDDLTSYLCVVTGNQLADLFDRYGSRLLEGNVRSFLGMKGNVNKGIRSTIQDEPGLFFAYNNGIAATASDVLVEQRDGQPVIVAFTDLQIVNGGQTTASVLSARKKDRLSLDGVSVPMKLTRVLPNVAQQLIPSIAEFANTQNKVAAADFFANHPFHRKMEEISRRLLTPARAGQRIQSKWFYERSRGQYQNERLYLSKSERTAFESEYPPNQLISKTDLAKYAHTWDAKPHLVSLGAQKNFARFASKFSSKADESEAEYWEKISPQYADTYFRNIVAVALIWQRMEGIVDAGRGSWYEGGYRANIITYTMAKLFHDARQRDAELDLERIWSAQDAGPAVAQELERLAPQVQKCILVPPPGVRNVGEWSKKEECWKTVAALRTEGASTTDSAVISRQRHAERKADSRKQGEVDDGIELQRQLLELTMKGYWASLYNWSRSTHHLAPTDLQLVSKASTQQGFVRITLAKDQKRLMTLKKLAEDEGFRHSS